MDHGCAKGGISRGAVRYRSQLPRTETKDCQISHATQRDPRRLHGALLQFTSREGGTGINVGEESEVSPSQNEAVRHRTLGSTLLDPMALPQPLLCA
jgi:hypothetical protein